MSQTNIRNTGVIERYVIFAGRREAIQPYQTRVVDGALADEFLAKCHPHVVREAGVNSVVVDTSYYGERSWLYNTSGNPDTPPTVTKTRRDSNGEDINVEMKNPIFAPRVVKHTAQGGSVKATRRGEETSLAQPPVTYEIFPYSRKSVPKHIGDWLLNRDAASDSPGLLRVASEPAEFEPQEDWTLDDIQIWMGIVSSTAIIGAREEDLRRWHTKQGKGFTELERHIGAANYRDLSTEAVVEMAKNLCLRRAFFMLADSRVNIPSRTDFEAVKATILEDRRVAMELSIDAKKVGKKVETVGASASF